MQAYNEGGPNRVPLNIPMKSRPSALNMSRIEASHDIYIYICTCIIVLSMFMEAGQWTHLFPSPRST